MASALSAAFSRGVGVDSRAQRQAEEDRQPGDGAEDEDLGGDKCQALLRCCKAYLTSGRDYSLDPGRTSSANRHGAGIRSTSTSRRSTSSPSRSASTGPRPTGSPTLASRVAEMLGVSRASAGRDAEAARGRGPHRARRAQGGAPDRDRPRARRARRPQAPDHRAAAHRLHGLHRRRGARPRRRARRHVHATTWSSGSTRSSATPSAARTAGRSTPTSSRRENRELAPLADLEPGDRATIVRLAEHDGDLLHWFYDQGLVPGRESRCAARSRRRAS